MPTQADRAADLMRGTAGPVLTLRRLAHLLGAQPAALSAELERDPRFRVVRGTPVIEQAAAWTEGVAPAYAAIVEAAGLTPSCTVLLADLAGHEETAAVLLARTLGCLLDLPTSIVYPATHAGAVEAAAALAPLMPTAGTSTTPPPPARPPAPARSRRRPPSWRPPRAPGSRRG